MVGPVKILEINLGVRPCEATLYQKVEIFHILGPRSYQREPISVKFRVTKWTHVHLGRAKFRCNESPLRCENADFGPVSKNGSLSLRGILPVTTSRHVCAHFITLRAPKLLQNSVITHNCEQKLKL